MTTRPVLLPDTEVHPVRSAAVGDDFEIWVARPQPGFAPAPPGPPGVLYVLDANLFFGTAVEMTRLMHGLYGELPPLLVVGVAYPGEGGLAGSALRNRDFTPTRDAGFAAMAAGLPRPDGSPPPEEPVTGGAAAFLRFLTDEVKPFVSSELGIGDHGGTVFGSSLGGLFVAWTLLTEPGAFENYIAVSPGLWWDDGVVLRLEEERAAEADDLPATAYLAVGSREEAPEVPMLARFRMITNVRELAGRLESRGYPSLEVRSAVLEGETHTSVVPAGLTRGLRAVLGRG